MNQGTIKFFNSTKGFGFIKNAETNEEIFMHITGLNGDANDLNEGTKVSYDVETDEKSNKEKAVNVTIL